MILVADVDIDLLRELHEFGAVRNLKDRREDVYTLKRTEVKANEATVSPSATKAKV
jgi:hypothetical protein